MKKHYIFYFLFFIFSTNFLYALEKKFVMGGIVSLGLGSLAYSRYLDVKGKLENSQPKSAYDVMVKRYEEMVIKNSIPKKYQVDADHQPQTNVMNAYIEEYKKTFNDVPRGFEKFKKKYGMGSKIFAYSQEDLEHGVSFEKLKKDYKSLIHYKSSMFFGFLSISALIYPWIHSLIKKK